LQNLFLPSVKLANKARVGSRLRRRYEVPQTPFQRVRASPTAHPDRVHELQTLHGRLDPFPLSQTIQAKLERIFQRSTAGMKASGSLSATIAKEERAIQRKTHRRAPSPQPRAEKKRKATARPKQGKTTTTGNILQLQDDSLKVTFLNCVTGRTSIRLVEAVIERMTGNSETVLSA
jgi:hypothetical protein